MFIADAQVHIWAQMNPERVWADGTRPHRERPHRDVPLKTEELLSRMDEAGVARAILIPPSWSWAVERNDYVLAAARSHPDRFAVMGRLDLDKPALPEVIAGWRQQPGMLGMRCSFNRPPQLVTALMEGELDWFWSAAEKAGFPVMVYVAHARLAAIDRVAERFPGLKLIMSHLAIPSGRKDTDAFDGLDNLLALAKRPNVAVKASALPCFTTDAYPYRQLHCHLKRVYDAFGPRRMLWGTDLARLPCSYRQGITMYTEEIPWLTRDDKEWIMGRSLCEWLGWPALTGMTLTKSSNTC